MQGLIIKMLSGFYTVECDGKRIVCRARGVFRKRGQSPLVGDQVEFTPAPDEKSDGVIEEIYPRKNALVRPPVANLDKLVIVSSARDPAPNLLIIDKLTAIACNKEIQPAVVFNKSDLNACTDFQLIYHKTGIPSFVVSAETGEGMQMLKEHLVGGITVLTGNTGVGKSSILNRIYPWLGLKTGDVSQKLGRGRHTTRHVELFQCEGGGYIADTPGFSSIDLERSEVIMKEDLQYVFPEFASYLGKCRFLSCAHVKEKDCVVRQAVEAGEIAQSRYESYCAMYEDVRELREWEIRGKEK